VAEKSDIFIIAVPTPFHEGFVPNTDYVEAAAKSIAPYLENGNYVILESTSPVGTTERIAEIFLEEGVCTENIHIAHCPERVLPGKIIKELVENDRLVGGLTEESTRLVADFYREFVKGKVFETNARLAEMAKLTENSFRDVNIAFANELSMICSDLGINVNELIMLANRHPRVNILQPGCGVGGHCIAVDPWFIVHAAKDKAKLIKTAREVNNKKSEWVIEQIKSKAAELTKSKNGKPVRIALLGLAFKPDIDDLRESPALYIARRLTAEVEHVVCCEPNISTDYFADNASEPVLAGLSEAVADADVVAVLVGHKEFKTLNKENCMDFCGVLG
jgi:UDP-N-acetyl-D-mannosaminuronic acid dehydrogenase